MGEGTLYDIDDYPIIYWQ